MARTTPDATSGPDSGEPTSSVSATDASTTQGRAAATQGEQAAAVTRVQIEEAPKDPDVLYDGSNTPQREPVKADYKPFVW